MKLQYQNIIIRNATIDDATILYHWWNDGRVMAHAGFYDGLKISLDDVIEQLKTENEVDFLGEQPQKYALQKVYISFSYKRNMNPGDFLVLYRKGTTPGKKAYESVITTIGIIDEVAYNFKNKEEFLKYCENRTVFNSNELEYFWRTKKETLLVIKFIYVKSLCKRLTLSYLWDKRIIQPCSGPRPFDIISDSDFDLLLNDSNTEIYIVR